MGRGTALTGDPTPAAGEPADASVGAADRRRGSDRLLGREPPRIAAMFGAIAPRYDLMNRLMTAGLDLRWRRAAAAEAGLVPGYRVLDACCGTGDLAFALAEACPACEVVGLDFTDAMVARAREKAAARRRRGLRAAEFVSGDLLDLPFADDRYDAATVGWGVRNVPDVPGAFAQLARVVRPGGRVVCLESTQPPDGWGTWAQRLWMGRVVPLLGRLVTGDASAYAYLPDSVATFPRAAELAAIMHAAGLRHVRYRRFGLGSVALHVGEVAGEPS